MPLQVWGRGGWGRRAFTHPVLSRTLVEVSVGVACVASCLFLSWGFSWVLLRHPPPKPLLGFRTCQHTLAQVWHPSVLNLWASLVHWKHQVDPSGPHLLHRTSKHPLSLQTLTHLPSKRVARAAPDPSGFPGGSPKPATLSHPPHTGR